MGKLIDPHRPWDHHDSRIRYDEPLSVALEIIPDLHARRDANVLVDNSLSDVCPRLNVHTMHENGIADLGVAVDLNHWGEEGMLDPPPADDASSG